MGTRPAPLPVARLVGVGLVVFLANAAMLVLQLVAGRLLAPFVGSSLETWTSVIGVFLAGIALGNGLGGKLADRYPTPRTLAALLGLGALSALWMVALPYLLDATGLHTAFPLGPRIPVLAAVLCLPAGLTLSLLTPLAIRLGLPDVAHAGRVAGMVFALSTLGCLVGNYLTGFVLIPMFSVNSLVYVSAGSLAVLAAVTAFWGAAESPNPSPNPLPEAGRGLESPPSLPGKGVGGVASAAFPDIRMAYAIVFLASFGGMTLELTASRVLAQFLGVSLYTWTGIIGVMLAGTALGNFLGGIAADALSKLPGKMTARAALAATLVLGGGAAVFILVALAGVTQLELFEKMSLIKQVLAYSFSLFFLPMLFLGMVSPQVIRLSVPDVAHAGAVAGRVYAWSTAGAIVGTFAAGYVLLSEFGMFRTVLLVALTLTLTSLLVAHPWRDLREVGGASDRSIVAGVLCGNLLLYLFSMVLGGVSGGLILTARKPDDMKFESNYYTIRLEDTPRPDGRGVMQKMMLDLLVHSYVDPDDPTFLFYEHEKVQLELLRAACGRNPNPRALVIGGGGYTFPRCARVQLPQAGVDVVEIDPAVTKVAYDHLGLKPEYGIRSFHMDGRQFVAERAAAEAPGGYDLVMTDAVNDLSVPAHLLTVEFNAAVKKALAKDGVYLLTVIDSIRDGNLWRAGVHTLRRTFAHVHLLSHHAFPADEEELNESGRQVYVIYASDRPLDVDAVRAEVRKQLGGAPGQALAAAGGLVAAGAGPTPHHVAVGGAAACLVKGAAVPVEVEVFTHACPQDRLDDFFGRRPATLLTDQYAPVDNLMAEVYRLR